MYTYNSYHVMVVKKCSGEIYMNMKSNNYDLLITLEPMSIIMQVLISHIYQESTWISTRKSQSAECT